MEISENIKRQVAAALLQARENYTGSDAQFAKGYGLNPSVFSRLKNGEMADLIGNEKWISIAQRLQIGINRPNWIVAKTEVYRNVEHDALICQNHSRSLIVVDNPEIGKSFCIKHLCSTSLKNAFYIDCSQCKDKQSFIRSIAKTIGIDSSGILREVKERLKYTLRMIERPLIVLDEAGDLEYKALLEFKEFWNATEGVCGWYLIGADGLAKKIQDGIKSRKVGFRELFSRLGSNFMKIVPTTPHEQKAFYNRLIADVLKVNLTEEEQADLNALVTLINVPNFQGELSGLRRAETILIAYRQDKRVLPKYQRTS